MALGMAGRPKRRARLMAEGKWPPAGKDVIRGEFETFKIKPAKKATKKSAGSKAKKPVDLTVWVHQFNAAMNQENCAKAQKLLKSLPRADRKHVDFDYYADAVHRTCGSDELDGLGAMSTGTKVGIGVGIAALLGGGIWWFMRSRKAKFTGRSVFANRGPLVDMSKTFDPATVRAITDARKSIPGLPGGAGAGGRDMF